MYPPTDTQKWLKPPDRQSIIDPLAEGRKGSVSEITWPFYVSVLDKPRFQPYPQHHLAGAFKFLHSWNYFQKLRFGANSILDGRIYQRLANDLFTTLRTLSRRATTVKVTRTRGNNIKTNHNNKQKNGCTRVFLKLCTFPSRPLTTFWSFWG